MKEKALDIAERIVDRARAMNDSSVNVFVYSKLLQGYCSSNQRKEAFALLAVCVCPSSASGLHLHPRLSHIPHTSSVLKDGVHRFVPLFSRSSTDID